MLAQAKVSLQIYSSHLLACQFCVVQGLPGDVPRLDPLKFKDHQLVFHNDIISGLFKQQAIATFCF